ncbi:stage V sporulation T C-terminal domain-containing protein [Pygmaiobacter massiliensis]|uniref:stage V sporulation T C-terminal domain-containing protein n=1 Tax=Pygmaiobacter massiliensis TaxID=1917873 RepID=UPI000C7D1BEF|nr:stage V sporulation T C-terminal domain-containing protein [Pygmaiobacter massiliensis]
MKATGIVRRIDDLGRVVIPKEIRRTLHIRVGEPLEIFVTGEGEVVFKKYSPLGDLWAIAGRYGEVLSKNACAPVLICDRDHVVTAAGFPKKDAVDRPLTRAFEDIVENRRLYVAQPGNSVPVFEDGPAVSIAAPILCRGDIAGAVVALAGDAPADDSQAKLIATAAAFLGRQLED